jgi:hypothetical protein
MSNYTGPITPEQVAASQFNIELFKKDIEELPDVGVSAGSLFSESTGCYCLFGLAAKAVLFMDARGATHNTRRSENIYDELAKRYGQYAGKRVIWTLADDCIERVRDRDQIYYPMPVPLKPVIELFLHEAAARLEERKTSDPHWGL